MKNKKITIEDLGPATDIPDNDRNYKISIEGLKIADFKYTPRKGLSGLFLEAFKKVQAVEELELQSRFK